MAEAKLTQVRARLTDLQRIETVLAHLVQRCDRAQGNVACPLIASLQRD